MRRATAGWSLQFATTTLAVLLAVAGLIVLATAYASRPHPPPQPARSSAGTINGSPSPATRVLAPSTRPHPEPTMPMLTTATPPGLRYSPPTLLNIPAIGVRTGFVQLGRNPDGTVAVPTSFDIAGWYTHSVTPGQNGPSIILGHVDSKAGPGIFYRLGALHPGDRVTITRADNRVVSFVIDGVRQYPKTGFPTIDVYGNTRGPTLRLITCGGTFDAATGHYLSNIVVYAHLA